MIRLVQQSNDGNVEIWDGPDMVGMIAATRSGFAIALGNPGGLDNGVAFDWTGEPISVRFRLNGLKDSE